MRGAGFRLRVFGDPVVEIDERSLGPDATHLFAAFVVLALQPQHRVTRQRLGTLLWPDAATNRRNERLRWLLSKMRSLGIPIDARVSDVAVPQSVIEIDYVTLLDELDAATPARWPRRIDEIDAVMRDYTPVFSSMLRRWVEDRRESIGDEILARLVPLLTQTRQRGDWAATERLARAIRRVSPFHEEATLALAEALCATGDKAHGMRVLDEYLAAIDSEASPMRLPAELLRRRITSHEDASAGGTRDIPFAGRRREMHRFQSLLAEASAGRGGALLCCGPAGIGKTRLLDEAATFAAAVGRAYVVRARCQTGDMLRPLSSLTDLVPRLLEAPGAAGCDPLALQLLTSLGDVGDLPDGTDPPAQDKWAFGSAPRREAVRDAVIDLLDAVSHENTLLIQIDDFQWSDSALGWLWEAVIPQTREYPVLWCFAARLDQPSDSETLFSTRLRPFINSEWLMGLDAGDASALLEELLVRGHKVPSPAVREALLERGGGIPLVLLELARHWQTAGDTATVPATLAAVMDARVARLTPQARRALQVSALLGTFSTLERLELVLRLARSEFIDALAQLESAGILTTDRAGAAHGHVLWAETALSHLEPSVKRVLHRHVAEQFDGELETMPSPAILWESARHWESSGQPERARVAVVRGAEYLAHIGLYLESADAYQRAIDQSSDLEQRRGYSRRRVDLFRLSGSWHRVPAEIDKHESLSRQVDPRASVHGDLEFTRRHAMFQTGGPAAGLAEDSLRCARDVHATQSHRLQAAHDCVRYGLEGGRRDITEEGHRILVTLKPATREEMQQYSLGEIMYNLVLGDQHRSAKVAREWLEYERTRGDNYMISWSARYAGFSALAIGDLAAARDAYLESMAAARASRLRLMLHCTHNELLQMELDYSDPQKAREQYELYRAECEPFAPEVPGVAFLMAMMRAQLAIAEGNGADALRFLPTEPRCAGERLARMIELSIRLRANLLMNPAREGGPEVHVIAAELASLLEVPTYSLGEVGATYAEYLDMYHGAEAADAFVRRFVEEICRELLPTRRLAPFVERVRRADGDALASNWVAGPAHGAGISNAGRLS